MKYTAEYYYQESENLKIKNAGLEQQNVKLTRVIEEVVGNYDIASQSNKWSFCTGDAIVTLKQALQEARG